LCRGFESLLREDESRYDANVKACARHLADLCGCMASLPKLYSRQATAGSVRVRGRLNSPAANAWRHCLAASSHLASIILSIRASNLFITLISA
jgi:hypothetical protein